MTKFTSYIFLALQIFCGQAVSGIWGDQEINHPPEPQNYKELSAKQKRELLWEHIQNTKYKKNLPPHQKLGVRVIWKMSKQGVWAKINHRSDFSPKGWVKYLHAVGTVAKIKFIASEDTPYTGLFKGANFGLLRMSLTSDPKKRGVAPGLAVKFLIDKDQDSANFSMLPSLETQGKNYNIFNRPYTNIIPPIGGAGPKWVHRIFSKVTNYPENLYLEEFAQQNEKGEKTDSVVFPLQIYLVPTAKIENNYSNKKHDIRVGLAALEPGITLFNVYSAEVKDQDFYDVFDKEKNAKAFKSKKLIGKIVLESKFVASKFGDQSLFFRHQAFLNK